MGEPYTRSRYCHLFLNGVYWGLYQTQERGDEDFAETYLGGDQGDYDVLNKGEHAPNSGNVYASEGTIDAWSNLWHIAEKEGFGGDYTDNYMKVLGRNPDGTRNPGFPILLDPTNLIVYIISTHYTADCDTPASMSANGVVNNIYSIRNRFDDETGGAHRLGFVHLRHDCEHTFGTANTGDKRTTYSQAMNDVTSYGTVEQNVEAGVKSYRFGQIEEFNPCELHYRLCKNAEYCRLFADLVQKYCLAPNAVLSPARAWALFQYRMNEVDDAVVAEAARWGKDQTRQTWLDACEECHYFITNRLPYFIQHYRARGWFPSIDAPTNDVPAGAIAPNTVVTFGVTNEVGDVAIYVTADGSDPADAATPLDSVEITSFPCTVKARAKKGDEWSALQEVTYVDARTSDSYYFTGTYTESPTILPRGEECTIVLDQATIPGELVLPGGVKYDIIVSNGVSTVAKIDGPGAHVALKGDENGSLQLVGEDTLVSLSNLIVKSGALVVQSTGVTATEDTAVISLNGRFELNGGSVDLDLAACTMKVYGIQLVNKSVKDEKGEDTIFAELKGGAFTATLGGGAKSAVFKGEKGSVDITFRSKDGKSPVVNVSLDANETRFVNFAGKIKIKDDCDITVVAADNAKDVKAFKSDKEIVISGGHVDVNVPGTGSEAFESSNAEDDKPGTATLEISGGTLEVVADDDCFNADQMITVSGGLIYARSLSNDCFDSNGSMVISGGTILAYATGKGHEAFDVEPKATEPANNAPLRMRALAAPAGGDTADDSAEHTLTISGGTIIATGGPDSAWPMNLSTGDGTSVYAQTGLAPADYSQKYLSVVGQGDTKMVTTTAQLPELSGSSFSLLATTPGMDPAAAPTLSATAPASGSTDFHDLSVVEQGAILSLVTDAGVESVTAKNGDSTLSLPYTNMAASTEIEISYALVDGYEINPTASSPIAATGTTFTFQLEEHTEISLLTQLKQFKFEVASPEHLRVVLKLADDTIVEPVTPGGALYSLPYGTENATIVCMAAPGYQFENGQLRCVLDVPNLDAEFAGAHTTTETVVVGGDELAVVRAQPTGQAADYVQDNLIAHWDAIENQGLGVLHDATATTWVDLVAGRPFTLDNATFHDDYLQFTGAADSYGTLSGDDTSATFLQAKNGTVEIVFALDGKPSASSLIFQSATSEGPSFGYNSSGWIVSNKSSGYIGVSSIAYNNSIETVSLPYASGAIAKSSTAYVDGRKVTTLSSASYWSAGTDALTYLGNRASKAAGFAGKIMAIRVYSDQLTAEEVAANRAVDVLRFKNGTYLGLNVVGEPKEVAEATPAYGMRTPEEVAVDTACVAPAVYETESVRANCLGWTLYGSETQYGNLDLVIGSGTGSSFEYPHPTQPLPRKLVWTWAVTNRVTASASGDGAVSTTEQWLAFGESIEITATPNAGNDFVRWTGDGVTAELAETNPLRLENVTAPMAVTAVFGAANDLQYAKLTLTEPTTFTYNGEEQGVSVASVVTAGGVELTADDYEVTGLTATDAGTYLVTVTGKDPYFNSTTAEWTIQRKNVAELDWTYNATNFWYTGLKGTYPTNTVTYEGRPLVENVDFTVTNWNSTAKTSYATSKALGVATGYKNRVYGKGNFTGMKEVTLFNVTRQLLYWKNASGEDESGIGSWNSEKWSTSTQYNETNTGNYDVLPAKPTALVAVYLYPTEGKTNSIDLTSGSTPFYSMQTDPTQNGLTRIHDGVLDLSQAYGSATEPWATGTYKPAVMVAKNGQLLFENVIFTNGTTTVKVVYPSGDGGCVTYAGTNKFVTGKTSDGKSSCYCTFGFGDVANVTNLFINGATTSSSQLALEGTTANDYYFVVSNATVRLAYIKQTHDNQKLHFVFQPDVVFNPEGADKPSMLTLSTVTPSNVSVFKKNSDAKVDARALGPGDYNIVTVTNAFDVGNSLFAPAKLLSKTQVSPGVKHSYTVVDADGKKTVRLHLKPVDLIDIPTLTASVVSYTGTPVAGLPINPYPADSGFSYSVTDAAGNPVAIDALQERGVYKLKATLADPENTSWADGTYAPKTYDFSISDTDITQFTVTIPDVEYNGNPQQPKLTFKNNAGTVIPLTEGVDYTVAWENNTDITTNGLAKATVTGIGVMTGSVSVEFHIMGRVYTWVGGEDGNGDWSDPAMWDREGVGIGNNWPGHASDGKDYAKFTNGTYQVSVNVADKDIAAYVDEPGVDVTFVATKPGDQWFLVRTQMENLNYPIHGRVTITSETDNRNNPIGLAYNNSKRPRLQGELIVRGIHNTANNISNQGLPVADGFLFDAPNATIVFDNTRIRRNGADDMSFNTDDPEMPVTLVFTNGTDFVHNQSSTNRIGNSATVTIEDSRLLMGVDAASFGGAFTISDSVLGLNKGNGSASDTFVLTNMTISGTDTKIGLSSGNLSAGDGEWTFVMPAGGFSNELSQIVGTYSNGSTRVTRYDVDLGIATRAPVVVTGTADFSDATVNVDASAITAVGRYPLVRSAGAAETPSAENVHVENAPAGTVATVEQAIDGNGLDLVIRNDISLLTVTAADVVYSTNSTVQTTTLTFEDADGNVIELREGVDYEVEWVNSTDVTTNGPATAKITGIGDWTKTNEADFHIMGNVFTWVGGEDGNGTWTDEMMWDREGVGIGHGWPGDNCTADDNTGIHFVIFTNGTYEVTVDIPIGQYKGDHVRYRSAEIADGVDVTFKMGAGGASVSAMEPCPTAVNGIVRIEGHSDAEPNKRSFPFDLGGDDGFDIMPKIYNEMHLVDVNHNPCGSAFVFETKNGSSPLVTITDSYNEQSAYGDGFISFGCTNENVFARLAMTNSIWLTTCGVDDANAVGQHAEVSYCNSTNLSGIIANYFQGSFTIDNSVVGYQNLHETGAKNTYHLIDGEEGDTFTATDLTIVGANTKLALSENAQVTGTLAFTMPEGGFKNDVELLGYKESTATGFKIDTSFAGVAPVAVAGDSFSAEAVNVDATEITTSGLYPLVRLGGSGAVPPSVVSSAVTGLPDTLYGEVRQATDGDKGLDLVVYERIELGGVTAANQTYAATALTPDLVFTDKDGSQLAGLVEGRDYTIKWTDPNGNPIAADAMTNAGIYTATVTGIGLYKGEIEGTFTIDKKELTVEGLTVDSKYFNNNSSATLSGGSLVGVCDGDDVTGVFPTTGTFSSISSGGATNENPWAGPNKRVKLDPVELTGAAVDNYTLTQPDVRGTILPVTIDTLDWYDERTKPPVAYNGTSFEESMKTGVVLTVEETTNKFYLSKMGKHPTGAIGLGGQWGYTFFTDEDCTQPASGDDFVNAGQVWVVATGTGSTKSIIGAATNVYTIAPRNISNCTITVTDASIGKDGNVVPPTVTVTDNLTGETVTLVKDRDYTVAIPTDPTPGPKTVTIEGIGNYTGTVTPEYKLKGNVYTWVGGPDGNGNWDDPMMWDREGVGIGDDWPGSDDKLSTDAKDTVIFTNGTYSVWLDNLCQVENYKDVICLKDFIDDTGVDLTLGIQHSPAEYDNLKKIQCYVRSNVKGTLHEVGRTKKANTLLNLGGGIDVTSTASNNGCPLITGALILEDVVQSPVGTAMAFGGTNPRLVVLSSDIYQSPWDAEFISFYNTNNNLAVTLAMTNSNWITTGDANSANAVGRNATLFYKDSTHLTGIVPKYYGGTFTIEDSVVGYEFVADSAAKAAGHLDDEGKILHIKEMTISGENTKFAVSGDEKLEGSVVITMPPAGFANITNRLQYGKESEQLLIDTSFSTNAPIAVGGTLDLRYGVFDVDASAMNEVPVGDYPLAAAKEGFKMPEAGLEQLTMQIKEPSNRHYRASLVTNVTDDASILALRLEWAYPTYSFGDEPPRIVIEDDWVEAATDLKPSVENYAAISNSLLTANAYGLSKWQAYVAGFDPEYAGNASGYIIALPDKNKETQKITLGNWPAQSRTNETSGMLFRLEESTQSDTGFTPVPGAVTNAPIFDVALPDAAQTTKYYRIQIEFRPRELKWLWFKALTNDVEVGFRKANRASNIKTYPDLDFDLEYTRDYGMSWQKFSKGAELNAATDKIGEKFSVEEDEFILVRAPKNVTNNSFCGYSFNMTGKVEVGGDVMSLISQDCPLTIPSSYCFKHLLQPNEARKNPTPEQEAEDYASIHALVSTERLKLPATQLTDGSYYIFMADNKSLVRGPLVLPAKKVYSDTYSTFEGSCPLLVNAPLILAEELLGTTYAFANMFQYDTESIEKFSAPFVRKSTDASAWNGLFRSASKLRALKRVEFGESSTYSFNASGNDSWRWYSDAKIDPNCELICPKALTECPDFKTRVCPEGMMKVVTWEELGEEL